MRFHKVGAALNRGDQAKYSVLRPDLLLFQSSVAFKVELTVKPYFHHSTLSMAVSLCTDLNLKAREVARAVLL